MKPNRLAIATFNLGMLALLFASPAFAGIYLETNPLIEGDATFAGYEDQIVISTLNTGGTNPGCSGAAGSPNLVEATFTKGVDSATVDLLTALRDRTVLLEATFRLTATIGSAAQTYKSLTFKNAILTSYGTSDDDAPDVTDLEVWTLSFSQLTVTYFEYDPGGSLIGTESVAMTPATCVGN
jgi:type VI protein secretion system component Hcp